MNVKHWITQVIPAIIARTGSYFLEEFSIQVAEAAPGGNTANEVLDIQGLTAVVGIGGPFSILVAFSFEQRLIDQLYVKMTEGLEIEASEEKMYRDSVAGDIVNNIVGNCTENLVSSGIRVTLTPPMIIDHVKNVHRMRGAVFISKILNTSFGRVDIHLIAPGELFDDKLNYKK